MWRLPLLRISCCHSERRRLAYWNGWRYPLLTHVTAKGCHFGRGGVLVIGPVQVWWQVAERFVAVGGNADAR